MLTSPERVENGRFLRRGAHGALRWLRRGERIQAKDFHAARSWFQFSCDLAQERRLAGAVRAEYGNKFSAPHFEIDPAIGFDPAAISLHETTYTDRGARVGGRHLLLRGAKSFRDRLVDFADQGGTQSGSTSQLN